LKPIRAILETRRLTLRPATSDDHAALHGLFTHPGVRRFIFDNVVIPPEQTADIIQRSITLFAERHYGLWLARVAPGHDSESTDTLIGFGAFWYFRDPPELELLYGVSDDHVGNGFGREIARAVMAYGFETLKMSTIRASTDAAHAGSRRLLEELGFVLERQEIVAGLDTVFYELRAGQES
jgi:[ribosomal protein S5]-alanine N-acetyltransferase